MAEREMESKSSGVHILICLPPPPIKKKNYCQIMFGKKYDTMRTKKRGVGECIFFPQLVKSMHIFSPIDLIFTKLQKKLIIFRLQRASPHYNKLPLGEKYESRGRGKNMNFKFNIHPCIYLVQGPPHLHQCCL